MKKIILLGIIIVIIFQAVPIANGAILKNNYNYTSSKKINVIPVPASVFHGIKVRKTKLESILEPHNSPIKKVETQVLSNWWNTSWEYRLNITITETLVNRENWPVDAWILFDPPAYKFSIRVIDHETTPSEKEIPYQPWNITYVNETHILSATITFLINISVGESRTFSIYWSTGYKDPPTYRKSVSVVTYDSTYEISSNKGWKIILPSTGGGTASTFIHQLGSKIQHKTKTHFGVTKNPSLTYEGFWGVGNTSNSQYTNRYIVEDTDPLLAYFKGVIFVTYHVENVPLISQGTKIAYVTYEYRFYPWGIICTETIKWAAAETGVTYYLGGWVFDQDDGPNESTFNHIAYPKRSFASKIALYYQTDFSTDPFASGWWIRKTNDVNNGALWDSTNGYVILTNPVNGIYGQIWFNETIYDPMIIEFDYKIGGGTGADGLVLMFYKKSNYNPRAGGCLGFTYNTGSDPGGDVPGYGVEFDNYRNGWDSSANHIAIIKDNVNDHLLQYDTSATEDNAWHHVKVEIYPQNGTIRVWLNGTLILDYRDSMGQLNTTYGGLGFSAATGGLNNYHIIDNVKIYRAIPEAEAISDAAFTQLPINANSNVAGYNLTFFHNVTGFAVGMVLLDFKNDSITFDEADLIWANNGTGGPEAEYEDYILWSVNVSNIRASENGYITLSYAVVPWIAPHPSSNIDGILDEWNLLAKRIITKPSVQRNVIERYLLRLHVKVVDIDNKEIPNANVSLKDPISGSIVYSKLTNASGIATFDIIRSMYNLNITVSEGVNYTYSIETAANYEYPYEQLENTTVTKLDIAKLTIYVYDKYNATYLSAAEIHLSTKTKTYVGLTNESGILLCYLSPGLYSLTLHKITSQDYFNISINGSLSASNVNSYVFTYSHATKIWLLDLNATNMIATVLELYQTPTIIEKYWNENITISVKLYNKTDGASLQGDFTLTVENPDLGTVHQETKSGQGTVTFEFNTSVLIAGYTYTAKISAHVTQINPTGDYVDPTPVYVSLTIKKIPLSIETTINPSSVYWNERLEIVVSCYAYGTTPVSGANVTIRIHLLNGTTKIYPNIGSIDKGKYCLAFDHITFDVGLYTFDVIAEKGNYTRIERTYYFTIEDRPTNLECPPKVNVPWKPYYILGVKYIDELTGEAISNANGTAELINLTSGQVVKTYEIYTFENNTYFFNISLQNIVEGDYIVNVTLSLRNYQTASAKILFELRLHKASIEIISAPSEINYLENIEIRFQIYDEDLDAYITDAHVMYTIYKTGVGAVLSGNGTYIGNNAWSVTIDTESIKTGSFIISISASKVHCETAYKNVYIIVKPAPTSANATTTIITTEWGFPISVNVTYSMERGRITNANATFVVKYGDKIIYKGKLSEIGGGVYQLYLNSSMIVNNTNYVFGTYTIYIYLGKKFYENQTIVVTWTIKKISTYCSPREIPVELEYGENITITYKLWYYKNGIEIALANADAIVKILMNNTIIYIAKLVEIKTGIYLLNLNTSSFINSSNPRLGAYTLKVIFTKKYFETSEAIISLTVNPISTVTNANPSNVTLYWGETTNISINWRALRDYSRISGASMEVIVLIEGINVSVPKDAIIVTEVDGVYILCVNTSLLNDGITYEIKVIFKKQFYQTQTCSAYVTVEPIPATAVLSTTKLKMTWGDDANVSLTIIDTYGKGVSNVEITMVDTIPEGSVYVTELGNGKYMIIVKGGLLSAGTNYTLYLEFRKEHYDIPPERLLIIVEKIKVKVEIETSTMIWKSISPFDYGKASSKLLIHVFEISTNIPVDITGEVLLDGELIGWINETVLVSPGVYEISISWDRVEPGTYRLGIQINTIIRGKYQGAWELAVSPTIYVNGVRSDYLGAVVNVDFISGHERIPGIGPVPKIYFWSLVGIVLVLSGIGIMKFIAWWRLPPEVKEIIKIIKMIKRGVYKYEAPPRKEFLMTAIKTELELT